MRDPTPPDDLIVAYLDRWGARAGESLQVMVSTSHPRFRAEVVHLRAGETFRDGKGFDERPLPNLPATEHAGRVQPLRPGSYATVPDSPALALGAFTVTAWIQPTATGRGLQTILAHTDGAGRGWALQVEPDRGLTLCLGAGPAQQAVASGVPLLDGTWYFAAATYDSATGVVELVQRPVPAWPVDPTSATVRSRIETPEAVTRRTGSPPLTMAARLTAHSDDPEAGATSEHFNGRLDRPRIFAASLTGAQLDLLAADGDPTAAGAPLVAAWDFSREIGTDRIVDAGPNALHGRLHQLPTRAVTDHTWRGQSLDWTLDASPYGAIHFHDDDLEDAGWTPDLVEHLPADLPSGLYAVKLTAARPGNREIGNVATGYAPFIVRPRSGAAASRLLFIASANTYTAYGTITREYDEVRSRWMGLPFPYPQQSWQRYAIDHSLLSLYDLHSDGSGVCYSSRRRPVLNFHPLTNDLHSADGLGYAHGFKQDLQIAGWLAAQGIDFDVVMDDDIHAEGVDLLRRYRAVMTGSHPEYWTGAALDAVEAYQRGGGRFLYLGGNGFYWVTSYHPTRPHVIEVRRWGGTRSWTAQPGEYRHSTTGEQGGLWRERGRAPQRLVGTGFTAQGDGIGRPFHRTAASMDPRVAWMFDGIGPDEPIGAVGTVMGAAAGNEVDRVDFELGTPRHALVVAQATGFDDAYQHVVEEVRSANSRQGGSVEDRVRADLVFYETPGGGAVFSVSSITFGGSLGMDGGRNAASRLLGNVVRRFLDERPFTGDEPSGAG